MKKFHQDNIRNLKAVAICGELINAFHTPQFDDLVDKVIERHRRKQDYETLSLATRQFLIRISS